MKDGVVRFLDANQDFIIRRKSIATHLAESPQSHGGLDAAVVKALKALQTTQSLTTRPKHFLRCPNLA